MCSMDGLADNDVAGGRKLQKMKNIVREACDEICQYVCDHKTNFSPIKGTESNPDYCINHVCCPVACADIYSSNRHERSLRKMFIGELEEQQNKKRRIGEETRGQAEDRIAMQLATDESLAAEMEEEGEDDKGTIDVAGLIGWKLNELEDKGTIDAAGLSDNQYEKFRRGRDLWEEVEQEDDEASWRSASDFKESEEQCK